MPVARIFPYITSSFWYKYNGIFFSSRNQMVATKYFAESAVFSSVGCVRSALILRLLTNISATMLLSFIIFCFMKYPI